MTITDETLLNAVQIYLEVCGMNRGQFIEELKDLASQTAPNRFDELLSDQEAA